jgi:hypothetical protein
MAGQVLAVITALLVILMLLTVMIMVAQAKG